MGGAAPPPEPGAQRVTARIVPQRIYVPTFAAIFGAVGSADEQARSEPISQKHDRRGNPDRVLTDLLSRTQGYVHPTGPP